MGSRPSRTPASARSTGCITGRDVRAGKTNRGFFSRTSLDGSTSRRRLSFRIIIAPEEEEKRRRRRTLWPVLSAIDKATTSSRRGEFDLKIRFDLLAFLPALLSADSIATRPFSRPVVRVGPYCQRNYTGNRTITEQRDARKTRPE